MEQTVEFEVDLFGQALPSAEQIKKLVNFVNSSEVNREQFIAALEENMSKTGASALATGIGLCIAGQYDKAVEKLEKADDCKEKFLYLSFAQSRTGLFGEAIASLDAAAANGAEKLMVDLEKLTVYRRAGDFDGAKKQLKECSNYAGISSDYHYQLGRLYEAQGQYQQAAENYEKAIELNPNHHEALFYLAYRCDLSGDEDAAIDYYRQAVATSPAHTNTLLNLAVLYEDASQFDKALKCINKVLQYHPNHQRAMLFKKDVESSETMFYDEEREERRSRKNQILETPISDFELSVRSRNCLEKMHINTLGDLLNISESELLSYKNFGETSLREIKAVLEVKSLKLGQALGSTELEAEQNIAQEQEDGVLNRSVDDLRLSVRAKKCLSKLNIRTLGDVARRTEAEFLGCKNFGVTSLNEIKKAITELGLSLRRLD